MQDAQRRLAGELLRHAVVDFVDGADERILLVCRLRRPSSRQVATARQGATSVAWRPLAAHAASVADRSFD